MKLLLMYEILDVTHFLPPLCMSSGCHTVGQDRQKCKETSNLDVIVVAVNRA